MVEETVVLVQVSPPGEQLDVVRLAFMLFGGRIKWLLLGIRNPYFAENTTERYTV